MADKAKPLDPKRDRFCLEYVKDLNATQAAVRAGYSKKTAKVQASRLLTNVNIKARIAELQSGVSKRLGLTQEWVVENLRTVAERCMQIEPVLDREGKPVMVETATGEEAPAYVFNATGANKSLELLGKHLGIFGEDNRQKAGTTTEDIIKALDERDDRTRQIAKEQHGNGVTDIRKPG